MVCSIFSLVTPSIGVGICGGSDVGWPLVRVMMPSNLADASTDAGAVDCAKALKLVSMAAAITDIGKPRASLVFMKFTL